MQNNTNNTNSKTLEFISLIKCILEYYATTKKINYNDGDSGNESVGELFKTLQNLETDNLMSIDLPGKMNEAIESAFVSHIKFFEEQLKNSN